MVTMALFWMGTIDSGDSSVGVGMESEHGNREARTIKHDDGIIFWCLLGVGFETGLSKRLSVT